LKGEPVPPADHVDLSQRAVEQQVLHLQVLRIDAHLAGEGEGNARRLRCTKTFHCGLDSLAAKIAALDLVITADNTVAHLAGAVGTPTWILLSQPASWYWLIEGDQSVWYRSVRLFRRGKEQQWDDVFQHLRRELLKTSFRLDEESSREHLAAPHWTSLPARANQ
jgi:hypothetical protein